MATGTEFYPYNLSANIQDHLLDRFRLTRFLGRFPTQTKGPQIIQFEPIQGYAGTMMVIIGSGFAEERERNHVEVGGSPAMVIQAAQDRLLVITHHETRSGPVKVTVDGNTATGAVQFKELPWPSPGSGEDGPPFSYAGAGAGGEPSAGTVPPTGTAKILVVNCNPTDKVPPDPATAKQDVIDTFVDVTEFYDQASYGALNVVVDVTDHVPLLENAAYYHRANGDRGYPNIDWAVVPQLMAECAQGAVDQDFNLDDYSVMVASVYMPGLSVRAWGGWSQNSFAYDDGGTVNINVVTAQPLGLIAQRHDADWGRAAHEFGHNLIDGGLVLGEDVYGSDLVAPNAATASNFEMMGNHDSHPLFTGFFLHQLGWYDAANIRDLTWDRNPFSQEYDVIAHGLSEDAAANRYHLIRIQVGNGLHYFIEVRQRPDPAAATPQIFDENIPLSLAGTPDGGVIVTKAIAAELNNNQETRLITLLQEENRVMIAGDEAVDPLRTLRITVVDDNVQARPRVCRVRVEWAQDIADTPGGDFDLRIEPWGPGYETEDIWVDRDPFGTYDFTDPAGNPTGNGDEPRPMEINRFYARVSCDGAVDASNVKVTHYAISPPGVGDNGAWTPLDTYTVGTVPANGSVQNFVNWVPLVGEHTCLKIAISQQLGEISGANNQAQENIFNFQPPASSVPEPAMMTVAVRNPLDVRVAVMLALEGTPEGYYVYFPHRWVWLPPKGERKLDLFVIPYIDFKELEIRQADVVLKGYVPHPYEKEIDITGVPASWTAPIGGILSRVTPKHRSEIELSEKVEKGDKQQLRVRGEVTPAIKGQKLRVDMTRPDGSITSTISETDQRGRFIAEFGIRQPTKRARILADRRPQVTIAKLRGAAKTREAVVVKTKAAEPKETEKKDAYMFQARIFNAKDVAPADSNLVYWAP